ncbi:glycoside hydrolase [Pilaira anomala]|nr:glycoside hydrolase [Pilaira anomala]
MGIKSTLGVMMNFYLCQNHFQIQASIVDSLDTMLIMGLEEEYKEALEFVEKINFSFSNTSSKGFETNIRYLGGLLAANDLRPNKMLVKKAVEVAEATLIPLFVPSTSLGSDLMVPLTYMNFKTNQPESGNTINLAEFGTYTMEFTRLSQVTGDPKYEQLANDLVNAAIEHPTRMPGLFPTTWTVNPFAPVDASTITIAGGGDSFYEYLIKNYMLQVDKSEAQKLTWQNSVESIEEYMLSPTSQNPDIQYVAMIGNSSVYYVSQELICYWPGNILLGITQVEDEDKKIKYRKFADTFYESCIEAWVKTETSIASESWSWVPQNDALEKKLIKLFEPNLKPSKQAKAKTSPEKRATEKKKTLNRSFNDIAETLFDSINELIRTEVGFTRLNNVDKRPVVLEDFQESFFFAETLKYLYLTFTDKNCISLNNYVFNTEAHPFILPEPIAYQS